MTAPWWKSGPERAGIKVHLDMKLRDKCLVKGNKNEIFEVLVNLIKNSVEALPEGGDIKVHAIVKEDQVILRLTDTGIGLAEEDLSRLFTPFFTTNVEAGRGLGLATSRSIVNAHGGEIAVTSTQGQGTTFIVSLPLAQEMPEQANITRDLVTYKRLTILVIDDMEPTVNLIKEALGEYKHSVFGAFSGKEGLEIVRENPVDLVICDLGMPEMNGWQVGKAMKDFCEEKGSAKVPFIMLTGWGDQSGEEQKMVESGVDAVIEKPIDIPGLMQAINGIVERRTANKAAGQKEST
jgi:CheY-like chemotaxis protein